MKHQLTKYYCTYNWCSTQNNLQKVQSICVYIYNVQTIGLLLQIHNTRCTLHIYSSIVEILEKYSWNYWTSFFKVNQYLTKCWLLIIGTIFSLSLDRMTCKLYYEYRNPFTNIAQTLNQISFQSLNFFFVICNCHMQLIFNCMQHINY
jgi:hypothetical protein